MTSAAEGSPGGGPPPGDTARPETPLDPRAVRVTESGGGPADADPTVVDPAGEPGLEVRWLGHGRVVVSGRGAAMDGVAVLLGSVEPAGQDGRSRREVVVGGWRAVFEVEPEGRARLRDRARRGREDTAHSGPLDVRAIIPGRVVGVSVAEGDVVEAGQQLLVIEAMKMQNELRSPRAGTVERIVVGAGQTVDLGALLLVLR